MGLYEGYTNESDLIRNFTYERLAKSTKGRDTQKRVEEWFRDLEKHNCLVNCSKLHARFHKRNCELATNIDRVNEPMYRKRLIHLMSSCDEKVCHIAKYVKTYI